MKKMQHVRLDTHVVPQKYELHLTPDLQKFTFDGEETIWLTLKKQSRSITLHSKDLHIRSVEAIVKKESPIKAKVTYDTRAETATFTFKETLPKGSVQLRIVFSGALGDNMRGFYRSSYTVGRETKYMATTQFESTDARRAFPCFDEPAIKATYDVSLTVPAKSTAISNTIPVETSKHEGGTKTVRFATTPIMSTYLLAFIVGDFEHIEKKSKDGVLVRVFVTPGKKRQAEFALDTAAKMISFFNSYFDIPYPLPVLDLIAIPDFASGAMENWGAITYRESALLVDPVHSSTINKQWVALVVAHEIAHQWFGNLVTMEWWTHLWLNEGFASYIEYLAVDHVFPTWDIWTQFLHADFGAALKLDGLKHTHPIEVEVHHPAEIAAVFDAVSYSKGASIIRMLAEYLGEKNFRNGLRYYLKKHSYGNTYTEDLWNALAKVSGKPVAKMMANWTGKAGYPLVSVDERGGHMHLTQARFFSSPISARQSKDTTRWHIPVSIVRGKRSSTSKLLMSERNARIPSGDSWVKLNADETGLYRTKYSTRLREMLAGPIEQKKLGTRDRLGLVRDIFALAETGDIATPEGLAFMAHYKSETEYVVWTEIASGLARIHALVAHEPFVRVFENFALDMFRTIGKKVSWNTTPKSHADALLKVLVIGAMGKYGDAQIIARAKEMFATAGKKSNSIPADLRGVVYDLVAKNSGAKEHQKLTRMYTLATLHEEKNRIGRALGQFKQRNLLEKTLRFALSKHVRSQDSVRIISSVILNPAGEATAWAFAKTHWKLLVQRYDDGRELSHLLASLEYSSSLDRARDIAKFLKKNPTPGTERTAQQVLEHIRSNAAWLARDRRELAAFFTS